MAADDDWKAQYGPRLDTAARATESVKLELEALANTASEMPPTPAEYEAVILNSLEVLARQLKVLAEAADASGRSVRKVVGDEPVAGVINGCAGTVKAFSVFRPSMSPAGAEHADRAVREMEHNVCRLLES